MGKTNSFGIIGGGLMGIKLAIDLKNQGHSVTILEGNDELGGLTLPWKLDNYTWDKFYHVILPDDRNTIELLEYAGLENEINWEETKTGFFIKDSYYSMSNILEFLKFPALNIFDKFRLGLTIIIGSYLKDYERLEKISVSTWLLKWSGKRTYYLIWLPLLKAKLGDGYKNTSAAFICATIKRLYGARKSSSKKEVFGYVNGGYSAILESLSKRIKESGIDIRTCFKVKEILRSGEKLWVKSVNNEELYFEYLISTLPSEFTAHLAPQLSEGEKKSLKNIKYLGVACVSVLLKKPLTPYYVTNITNPDIPFTGVIEMTALVNKRFFGGNSLVYLPKYLDSGNRMFELKDEELIDYFIKELKKMQPGLMKEDIITARVARARFVITLPEMGYSQNLHGYSTSVKNLFIINSAFITDGTLNVNETLKVAKNYLPKVLSIIKNEK